MIEPKPVPIVDYSLANMYTRERLMRCLSVIVLVILVLQGAVANAFDQHVQRVGYSDVVNQYAEESTDNAMQTTDQHEDNQSNQLQSTDQAQTEGENSTGQEKEATGNNSSTGNDYAGSAKEQLQAVEQSENLAGNQAENNPDINASTTEKQINESHNDQNQMQTSAPQATETNKSGSLKYIILLLLAIIVIRNLSMRMGHIGHEFKVAMGQYFRPMAY